MNTAVLQPNVQELQADVITLLEKISRLMARASKALKTDSSGDRYTQFQQEILNEASKVKHLELRMAIVAPMKAGKSTIINAIVGQDLLPSRNAAMTTLPTEIVLQAHAQEPVLVVPEETFSVFARAHRSLQNTIQNHGLEWVYSRLGEYPHLRNLVQNIHETVEFPVQTKTRGREEIIETLMHLNDLVRLSSLLESKDLLNQVMDVPRIETPFWQAQSSGESEVLGNLVIVDTPGPNEATSYANQTGNSFKLATVVKEQLAKSSIVLIVLDFTQLKTEAAEKVKQDVQQVIRLRGKDSLYVLINKVDQRLDNDMNSEQVRQFVAAEFDIGNDSDENRVFEVSARFAFAAANFIQELEENPGVAIDAMKAAEPLARQVYGRKWEKNLNRAIEINDTTDLREEADSLWQDSGFNTFLKNAIKILIERAAPKCIKQALELSQVRLVQLQEDIELRKRGIAKEAGELQNQVNELEADLERLNLCHARLNDVSKIKAKLHQQLRQILAKLQEQAKINLENHWNQEEYGHADFVGKRRIEVENAANWVAKQLGVEIDQRQKVMTCKTKSQAEEFADRTIDFAKQRLSESLQESSKEVQRQIENARKDLNKQLKDNTEPIIKKARQRLNQAFNVNLLLPEFSAINDDLKISKARVSSQHRYIPQPEETKYIDDRSFWHWFWLVPYKKAIKFKPPAKREDYYTVSLEELTKNINSSIAESIATISQGINEYLEKDFQDRINIFFEDLDSYLRRYKESLQQAQSDKKLSQDAKEQLVVELRTIAPELASLISNIRSYIQQVDDFLENM